VPVFFFFVFLFRCFGAGSLVCRARATRTKLGLYRGGVAPLGSPFFSYITEHGGMAFSFFIFFLFLKGKGRTRCFDDLGQDTFLLNKQGAKEGMGLFFSFCTAFLGGLDSWDLGFGLTRL
jgi:hypothetical protein